EMFDLRAAQMLVDRDQSEIAASLGRLVQRRHLRLVKGGFRFYHALVHEAAYQRLTMTDRMHLHARFARGGVGRSDVAALAHHWWDALRPPDGDWVWQGTPDLEQMRDEAIDAHIAAGQRFADQDSHERAIEFLE